MDADEDVEFAIDEEAELDADDDVELVTDDEVEFVADEDVELTAIEDLKADFDDVDGGKADFWHEATIGAGCVTDDATTLAPDIILSANELAFLLGLLLLLVFLNP